MHFSKTYRTTTDTHVGNPFSLSPTSMSKTGSQISQLSNRGTNCDRLSIGNFSEQFEVNIHGGPGFNHHFCKPAKVELYLDLRPKSAGESEPLRFTASL